MSVQKLIAEADKLLEKGKVPEALDKLKTAFSSEPMNQLVATKLANIFVEGGDSQKAAKVYVGLANRLSEAGKAQVAIAVYKQALELNPDDIELKFRFAKECEGVGKLGDALVYAQQVLQFYIQRKKYFDASNIMPLLVRVHTRDESFKMAWIEVMQYSQAEQKLPHLLVALCGPPGLASTEFAKGGEPTAMSETLYEALKRLAAWFPRDAKLAYSIAWCAYRREKKKDFYKYIGECLRRDPDFCLAMLLFARDLAEQKKLNESLFVYKFVKERLTADRSVDMLTLNRQVESFLEKNGWINFTDGMDGEPLDAKTFYESMVGEKPIEEVKADAVSEGSDETKEQKREEANIDLPAEIELSPSSGSDNGQAPVELQLTGGETRLIQGQSQVAGSEKPQRSVAQEPKPAPKLEPKQETKSAPAAAPAPAPTASNHDDNEESVEFTSILKINREELNKPIEEESQEKTSVIPSAAAGVVKEDSIVIAPDLKSEDLDTGVERKIQNELKSAFDLKTSSEVAVPTLPQESAPSSAQAAAPIEEAPKKGGKPLFNPMAAMEEAKAAGVQQTAEKTQAFSPIELLQASNVAAQQKIPEPETKTDISLEEKKEAPEAPSPSTYVEGERTMMFSPFEAVDAGVASRRPMEVKRNLNVPTPPVFTQPQVPSQDATMILNPGAVEELKVDVVPSTEATMIVPAIEPVQVQAPSMSPPSPPPLPSMAKKVEVVLSPIEVAPIPTPVKVEPEPIKAEEQKVENKIEPAAVVLAEVQPALSVKSEVVAEEKSKDPLPVESPKALEPEKPLAFSPIPEAPPVVDSEEVADLGDDLLEGPTKLLIKPNPKDSTAHLLKELKQELDEKKGNLDSGLLFRKAERYIAKRNYYLARKALRHAQALGADENQVKEKLREIRKLELPDGLYSAVSTDESSPERSEAILEKLEEEFDLVSDEDAQEQDEISILIEQRIAEVLEDVDAKTALDFGVALHEMGLFKNAETLLMGIVDRHPESAFDAYYLAAISKSARKDYAGAASILKMLSSDSARSEQQKISVYYALGELFQRMKQDTKSRSFFKKVAEIDSNYRNIREKLEE